MSDKELKELRDQINDLDNKIVDLIDLRSNIVTSIGKLKDKTKGVIDESREQEVLNRLIHLSKGKYSKDIIIRIWRELFEASSKLQLGNNSNILTKRSIESINVYKGGIAKIDGKNKIVKLSSNENPFGPSDKILSPLNHKFDLHRYPEISGITLRSELAKFHNINAEQIVLGCGSDENLLFAALSFCQPGDEIIHAHHGFEMYPIISKVVGAVSKLAKEENYKVSVQSICDQITPATKLIYIANPNNPTGSYLTKKDLRELISKVPNHIIVVIDGAYAEYVQEEDYDCDFSLVKEFENVICTRTFSKVYGLAGIRLGWCYSSIKVANILNKVKGPFNTNSFAQHLAMIALKDQDHIKKVLNTNKENKIWFEKELERMKFKYIQSFANFVFIELTELKANNIASNLLENGIIIRQLNSYQLPHCLRITIGSLDDMKKIVSVLEKHK
mgnify:FL=1